MRQKAVHKVEQELHEFTEEDGNIEMVNNDVSNSNAKSSGILEKIKSSSYQNSVNI